MGDASGDRIAGCSNLEEPMSNSELSVEEIDEGFVPIPRLDLALAEIDGELVIAAPFDDQHPHAFDSHWLDGIAAFFWNQLDGVSSVDDIADVFSAAFSADPQVVRNDLLDLTRTLARAGLFAGVRPERPVPHAHHQPTGVPVGTEVPPFRSIDLEGVESTQEDLKGQTTLLVNWSPTCGYCVRSAKDLAQVGLQLMFMASGTVDDNRRVREESGLQQRILLQDGFELFAGIGTPSAYLVDEHGLIASDLVVGADQVLNLARRTAGLD